MARLWIDPSESDYESRIVHTCDHCEDEILKGEEFFDLDGIIFCERCMEEYLEDLKNDTRRTAGEEEEE